MGTIYAADIIAGRSTFGDITFDNTGTHALGAVKAIARVLYGPERSMARTMTAAEERQYQLRGMRSACVDACGGDEIAAGELFELATEWATEL